MTASIGQPVRACGCARSACRQFRQIPGPDGAALPVLEAGRFRDRVLRGAASSGLSRWAAGVRVYLLRCPGVGGAGLRVETRWEATWNREGIIVFMSSAFTLHKVSIAGLRDPRPWRLPRLGERPRLPIAGLHFFQTVGGLFYLALKQPDESWRPAHRIAGRQQQSISLGTVRSTRVYSAGPPDLSQWRSSGCPKARRRCGHD